MRSFRGKREDPFEISRRRLEDTPQDFPEFPVVSQADLKKVTRGLGLFARGFGALWIATAVLSVLLVLASIFALVSIGIHYLR